MSNSDEISSPTLSDFVWRELWIVRDAGRLLLRLPFLTRGPHGQGRPVMVVPGFGTSDRATWVLRRYLSWLGYHVVGWGLGTNPGDVEKNLPRVVAQVEKFHQEQGQKIRLVGWSLGGFIVREIARDHPGMIHSVISLGTPIKGGPRHTVFEAHYKKRGVDFDAIDRKIQKRNIKPIKVPLVSIYSRSDGVVSWQASVDDDPRHQIKNVQVRSSHFGFGVHFDVYKLLAKFLAE